MARLKDRFRFFQAARPGGAFLLVLLLAVSWPALAASPITGVTVSPLTKNISSGQAVYLRAAVQGSGGFDRRVNWSLTPLSAGSVSPTGLFISDPAFTGTATVTATSVEKPAAGGAATVTVTAGGGTMHVDGNNAGDQDGSALHPCRTIQAAIDIAGDGDTVKVAQGTYTENVVLNHAVLLLAGFQGNSAANYAAGQPGDFVTRSTDHVSRVTTIQSPSRANPVVGLENWAPPEPVTYAVDGFTLTGGFNGVSVDGSGPVDFFISQNLITNNGPETPVTYDAGGGIRAEGVNTLVLDNQILNNRTDWGGGFFIWTGANTFLVQGNLIENNTALGGLGCGGGSLETNQEQGTGLFTWNIVVGNTAGNLSSWGGAGGLYAGGGPVELSHNIYSYNQAKDNGGGILLAGETAVLRHELIYKNNIASDYDAAGVHLESQNPANVTLEHCTITRNVNANEASTGGLYVSANATVQATNSIIRGNSGNQLHVDSGGVLNMTYSNCQDYPGTGNIDAYACFANPDADDYHLKSRQGRWNPGLGRWVKDAVHSPCIDAGNPASAFDQEPVPNGLRANMGVYGNTPEASKSQIFPLGGALELLLGE